MKGSEIIKHSSGSLIKTVENGLAITNKLLGPNLKPISIVHLDDHTLFSTGVGNCIKKKFPNALIRNIKDGNEALEHILHCFELKEKINLVITDISHPGLDGITFSKTLREKENDIDNRIPLLFITMHTDKSVVAKVKSIPFTTYLSKAAGCLKITTAIENLI